MSKGLEYKDGKFTGADDFINDFKAKNKGVFVEDTKISEPQVTTTPAYIYTPQSGTTAPDMASQIAQAIAGTI